MKNIFKKIFNYRSKKFKELVGKIMEEDNKLKPLFDK